MNLKNNRKQILLALILILQLTLVACSSDSYSTYVEDELNSELNIDGIEFLIHKTKTEEILGTDYELSPCVYGYEMTFDKINLTIGIDKDDLVRKVIVKNSDFSVLSIHINDNKSDAIDILTKKGFSKKNSDMYVNKFISVKLLSDGEEINGIILEKIES